MKAWIDQIVESIRAAQAMTPSLKLQNDFSRKLNIRSRPGPSPWHTSRG